MKFAIIAIVAFIIGLAWGVGIMNILHDRKCRPSTGSGHSSADDSKRTNSNRGKEWLDFSPVVLAHIDIYTIPQWGDKPNDQLHTEWTIDDCMLAIKKYANRAGKNSRGPFEDLRDLLKIAHYACVAWHKRQGL